MTSKTHWHPIAAFRAVMSIGAVIAATQSPGPAAAQDVSSVVQSVEMRHYKSAEWNFELDVPKGWNRFPPVSSNSPFEVTRFLSNANGVSNLIVFRNPYGPNATLQAAVDGSRKVLEKGGFANFVEGEATIGTKTVKTLEFDQMLNGRPWHCRQYYIPDGTLLYVLGFGTTDPDLMFPLDDRIAKTFVTTD